MTKQNPCAEIGSVIQNAGFSGEVTGYKPFGNGHINDTFSVKCREEDGTTVKYILQRINHEVFKRPYEVMENVVNITDWLRRRIIEANGDPHRETVSFLPMPDGTYCYRDAIGSYWRSYRFIDDALSFEQVERAEDFYQSAVAFGRFQKLLSDFRADTLHETIKDFHNTPLRYAAFEKAVTENICGRVAQAREEIEFIRERKEELSVLMDLLREGKLPLRVTHNDTKLNNVLFDNKTRRAICVIDLDTVMPGLSLNDFGDSIRFGASTAAEDEQDLSKVALDLGLFELYTKGYLEGCEGSLTQKEKEMMPMGAKLITLECGMRFLTDYLQGDTYFKIHREGHNLDRCRTQFKLAADMENKWDDMREIVEKY